MTAETATQIDYRKNSMGPYTGRITINTRIRAGQILRLRIRARHYVIDWGDGILQNRLTHLYLEGGFQRIHIIGERINWLDISDWNALQIYITDCDFLARLWCRGNRLTKLNLINCPFLVYLDCSHNRLDHIQASHLKLLKEVKANDNNLKIVDFSGCSQLQHVDLRNNHSFMAITQGCRKIKDLHFDEVTFYPEDYKKVNDDFPAVVINEGPSLTIRGSKELT